MNESICPAPRPVALVTGASGGIGAAAARLLAAEGYGLALQYHKGRDRAEALTQELRAAGADAYCFCADVSQGDAVRDMAAAARVCLGPVTHLLCCAGHGLWRLFSDTEEAAWRRMFAVHVDGAYHCCQAVLPSMLAQKTGSIVLMSSMWGQVGASCEVAYSAAKAALIGLTKALAKELGPSGIRVNCVAPGYIHTAMNSYPPEVVAAFAEDTPLLRIGTPEEAAQAAVFLLSDRAGFVTGQVLAPNGGFVV